MFQFLMKANFHIFSFVPHVFSVRPKTCYEIQVHEYLLLFSLRILSF